MTNFLLYLCFFCKIGNWIKNAWNKIVDALKEVANFFVDLAEKILTFIIDKVLGPIIEVVIEPILEAVFGTFSEILKEIVSNIMPVIEKFLIDIAEPIFNMIISVLDIILAPIRFAIFTGLLRIIDLLEQAFDVFSGIADIEYNGSQDFLLNVFFKNNAINQVFWAITLVALAILIIFTIIAVLKSMSDLEVKRPVGQILGMSLRAGVILFIVPFLSLVLVNLTSVVLRKTSEIVTLTTVGETQPSLGTLTFLTFTMNAAREDKYNENASLTDELRASYMSGEKSYAIDGIGDFAIEKIHYTLAYIVCLVMAFIIILCALVFIVKIFEVLLLYITSPFFVATIVLDDGEKFKEWCKMFIAKLLSGFGMVVVMKLFFIISPIIMSDRISFSDSDLLNLLVKTLFLIGGLWAAYKSGNLVLQIVNINAAYQEAGLSSEVATRAVKAGIKYGTMAVKAVASGGATLATDATKMAIDAAKGAGKMVTQGEGNSKGSQSGNAFRDNGKSNERPTSGSVKSDSRNNMGSDKSGSIGGGKSELGKMSSSFSGRK